MSGKPFIPTEFDIRLGNLIQITRIRMGMSQKDLAEKLGITFQQVQKYETASNRIAASRLKSIADVFEIQMSALLNESTKPYLHDEQIIYVIKQMYRADKTKRKLILQVADAITNGL